MSTFRKFPWESLTNRHGKTLKPEVLAMLVDLVHLLSEQEMSLTSLLNQGLRMPDNFDGALLSYTSNGAPNTQDTVAHGLRKVPSYFIVLSKDKAGDIYKSAAFDATNVYFKNSVASVATTIFVF
jgi:hypothetical protein